MTTTLSIVPVRFEYACGHTALVSLPRVKAERLGQRIKRVNQEKAAARQRACDFCPPAPVPIVVHSNNVVDVSRATADNAPLDHADTRDRVRDKEPEETLILTTTDSAAQPVPLHPRGVFPARKLSGEQELELTRLYAETPTPLDEIRKRYGIALASVARIAQRNGATLRRPSMSRAQASATPVAAGPNGRDQAVKPETTPAVLEPAAQPTTVRRPKAVSTRRRPSAPVAHGTAADAPVEAQVTDSVPVATTKRGLRTAGVRSSTELRQFVVTFTAEQTFDAASVLDALQQAQARGATEVTSIARIA